MILRFLGNESNKTQLNIKTTLFDRKQLKNIIVVLLSIVIMALLAIPNLENREMWIDEAHNAVIGKNTLEYGYPRIWDGNNFAPFSHGDNMLGDFLEMQLNWFPEPVRNWTC